MSAAPVVLTIAGSDSGGGAGIQADLKTFTSLGAFGTTAITCITAQNPDGVRGVAPIDPDMVVAQINAVYDAFDVCAVKTGMLYSAEIVSAAASVLKERNVRNLVVDPVLVATSGDDLASGNALETMASELLPLATLITPNVHEAAVLTGKEVSSVEDMENAAKELECRFKTSCVVTGGDLDDADEISNLLCYEGALKRIPCRRVPAVSTHGTGCTFSAASAAFLMLGEDVPTVVEMACNYVASRLSTL
ncbi:bifunctional hydroxymethylpyrimidine kinase/phosphomethylpyrimidine kinase [bacterium B17]|nr:bifunctional hydroxymethylpyrimidine kinase/phosphomethylpyrimidine kinase [bacterium B17]